MDEKSAWDTLNSLLNIVSLFMQRSPSYSQEKKDEYYALVKQLQIHTMAEVRDLSLIKLLKQEAALLATSYASEIKEKKMIMVEEKFVSKGILGGS